MNPEETEKQATALYKHVKDLSMWKYDSEIKREDSLIQQSSNMQTAFSFMTAAVFMAVPILIEYRGSLSLEFFLLSTSSVILFLLVSLITASLAQRRVLYKSLQSIPEIHQFVIDNWQECLSEAQQMKQWVEALGEIQIRKAEVNKERILLIRASMASFFISIALIIFWFVVAIAKII